MLDQAIIYADLRLLTNVDLMRRFLSLPEAPNGERDRDAEALVIEMERRRLI
jgi:hypothetical protein